MNPSSTFSLNVLQPNSSGVLLQKPLALLLVLKTFLSFSGGFHSLFLPAVTLKLLACSNLLGNMEVEK
jgi:hypothetical protein